MEATGTLADALLGDLNDLSDLEESNDLPEDSNSLPDQEADVSAASAFKTHKKSRLLDNASLQLHLDRIAQETPTVEANSTTTSQARHEAQSKNHQLVVESNKWLAKLSEELQEVHGELAAAYNPRFPELEELLPNPLQYKNAVRVIGNELDLTKVHDKLTQILNSNQIITLSVASSTTSGRILTDEELEGVDEIASYMESIFEVEQQLIQFVENSMEALSPSVSALIGPSLAARLLGLAGGLEELTKIPACNLQVMGQTKQNSTSQAGFSNASARRHEGVLSECSLIQNCPRNLQKKALKAVAGKLALAARFDFVNVDSGRSRSAEAGLKFREELSRKFEKLQEPDKAPVLKALPKPDLTIKKRRGGKRMRRYKERYEETAMMKQANTRAFSVQAGEYGDDAMGVTMGLLDTADNGGNIRKAVETKKTRQVNTKASRKRALQMAQRASNSNGLATSVVFNTSSSMELVNPEAQKDRVREANRKWFDNKAGFMSALPPSK